MGGGLSAFASSPEGGALRLIELSKFEECGRIPRSPEDFNLTVGVVEIQTKECFIVFVSHRWCRSHMYTPGFSGRPETDTLNNDMFKLCVSGIRYLWSRYAADTKNCYLWIDYSCLKQSVYPARELSDLKSIISLCDCLFTPIHDIHCHEMEMHASGKYSGYKANQWISEPEGYLYRSWCRIEVLFGAFTPLSIETKRKCNDFTGVLRIPLKDGRRPHFLYSTEMMQCSKSPSVIPPPQCSFINSLHPLKGWLSNSQDMSKIKSLFEELMHLVGNNREALLRKYTGEYNEYGQRHGFGRMVIPISDGNGNFIEHFYEGSWVNNEMDGIGTYIFGDTGHKYEGSFSKNAIKGFGKHTYSDGSSFEGQCDGTIRVGYGKNVYANGDKYEGEYVNDWKEGHGKLIYANDYGTYEGYFKDDLRDGFGFFEFSCGTYEGTWSKDKMDGHGTCRYLNGDMYVGSWKDGMLHGKGEFRYNNGDIYVGDFVHGKEHGRGKFSSVTGDVYEGEYINGVRYGHGKQVFKDGKSYEGNFKNDKMCGEGKIVYSDGSSYSGEFKDGMKNGHGTLITEKGNCIYCGMFKLGKKHGKGVMTYQSSGDIYDGEWIWDSFQIH